MPKKEVHEDQKYIVGLLENNAFVIREIYDKFASKVIHYIKKNSGTTEKAKDLIQEVLIVIYNQAKDKKLKLTCPFDAYFFLLCKRKWLNELKKKKPNEVTILEEVVSKSDEANELVFETTLQEQKHQLFEYMFEKLGKACKDVLKASFSLKNMDEVAKKLNISYAYARKKKSQCIGQLTKLITTSSQFKDLKNN